MKDICMLLLFAIIACGGYLAVTKLDTFLAGSDSLLSDAALRSRRQIKIGAQTPAQLKDISSALQFCSDAFPYIDFSCGCDTEAHILNKLENQKLDIALLANNYEADIPDGYRSIHVVYPSTAHNSLQGFLSEKKAGADDLLVVWNPEILSKNRDRILLMIENQSFCKAVV